MKDYQKDLRAHLSRYAREQLGVTEPGIFRWRGQDLPYDHILPAEKADLNFLAHCRSELLLYLEANPRIKPHRFFHHLSSSQAFAFNLFFPFLTSEAPDSAAFFLHFGTEQPGRNDWEFESIPDRREGTNVDVAWTADNGGRLYCEVKLTEAEFGAVQNLPKYRVKLETINRDRLSSLVPARYLEPAVFRAHYQILRNLALLHRNPRDRLVFLLPRENEQVQRRLTPFLAELPPATRSRVRVVLTEELLESLLSGASLPDPLRTHTAAVAAKYIPSPNQN